MARGAVVPWEHGRVSALLGGFRRGAALVVGVHASEQDRETLGTLAPPLASASRERRLGARWRTGGGVRSRAGGGLGRRGGRLGHLLLRPCHRWQMAGDRQEGTRGEGETPRGEGGASRGADAVADRGSDRGRPGGRCTTRDGSPWNEGTRTTGRGRPKKGWDESTMVT